MSVEEALKIGENISQYTFREGDEDIEKHLKEELGNFDSVLVGTEEKSARGFELSYDDESKFYQIRLFTPCSIGDWEVALDYMEKLALYVKSHNIVDEDGNEYSVESIKKYPYIENIEWGIAGIVDDFKRYNSECYIIFGIYRPVAFNKKMIDRISCSSNPAKEFSDIITEIQYIDAYSATQKIYKRDNGYIFGAYVLTEGCRTILPYKPSVEFYNIDIAKDKDISSWMISLVVINGDPSNIDSYDGLGLVDYSKVIENLPSDKYSFIDGKYIVIEPLEKDEMKKLYSLSQKRYGKRGFFKRMFGF